MDDAAPRLLLLMLATPCTWVLSCCSFGRTLQSLNEPHPYEGGTLHVFTLAAYLLQWLIISAFMINEQPPEMKIDDFVVLLDRCRGQGQGS